MSRELPQITLQQRQMMMTVIWLALIMGVVTFGMIVTFIGLKEEPGKGLPVITYLGMGLAALMLVLRMIIPNMIARNQFTQAMQEAREEGNQDEEQMLGTFYQIFMVRMIIGLALLEGAAMINLVAVMVENQKLAFIPVSILLLVMIASMPTKSKLDGWIRNQMENYNLEHQN
ncbi:hypothetical protein [Gimesia maris]|uniref:DUF2975 domain-containing protein n=1 Tax=Gimesia maris TaxID=122 RepID=A0ABX5YUC3_9PLAN|nr:hypothetical protein [Gimesia maris]EDL58719.1 hypothetical protein PM8797T_14766 [Gimesia maris DSM 8797]QDU17147.1 hypothetical protein CA11_49860 [Gimesia maris]QEG19203.1 hypothetical protein GmarT_51000 [Gimesia maris]QGQ27918.1 hypothetical protein F1729_04205 [Gimesia maris]